MVVEITRHDGGIALFRISAEAARNAFDAESMSLIATELNALMDDAEVRAVIITGTGRVFCAGADIDAFRSAIDEGTIADLVKELTDTLHPLQVRMRGDDTVFIAAMNGAAAGGGLGLGLACDMRIAGPRAKLAAAFFSLGLSPDGGTTWLLPRLVGTQVTRRFFFENEVWDAEAALTHGAVDEITTDEELIPRAMEVAREWGKWSAFSRRSTKQLLDASTATFFQTQLELEQALIVAGAQTPAFEEGVNAFLEKRDPDFSAA